MKPSGRTPDKGTSRAVIFCAAGLLLLGVFAGSCTRYKPSSPERNYAQPLIKLAPESAAERSNRERASRAGVDRPISSLAAESLVAEIEPFEPLRSPARAQWINQYAVGRDFDSLYFGEDSTDLRFATRHALNEYAEWLRGHPEVGLSVAGHCDRTGSVEYNYNLGMVRAWVVKDHLVRMDVPPDRLFTISFGEERPIVASGSAGETALNRRVEFVAFILPERSTENLQTNAAPAPPEPRPPADPPIFVEMP